MATSLKSRIACAPGKSANATIANRFVTISHRLLLKCHLVPYLRISTHINLSNPPLVISARSILVCYHAFAYPYQSAKYILTSCAHETKTHYKQTVMTVCVKWNNVKTLNYRFLTSRAAVILSLVMFRLYALCISFLSLTLRSLLLSLSLMHYWCINNAP